MLLLAPIHYCPLPTAHLLLIRGAERCFRDVNVEFNGFDDGDDASDGWNVRGRLVWNHQTFDKAMIAELLRHG